MGAAVALRGGLEGAQARWLTAPTPAPAWTQPRRRAVAALVEVLRSIDTGRPSRVGARRPATTRPCSRSTTEPGLALSTDGVGTKVIVAEQLERYDTVGIDCVAMNVNDLVCVGAEPIALLDYIAVEDADPEMLRQIALGPEGGRRAGRRGDPRRRAGRSCPS